MKIENAEFRRIFQGFLFRKIKWLASLAKMRHFGYFSNTVVHGWVWLTKQSSSLQVCSFCGFFNRLIFFYFQFVFFFYFLLIFQWLAMHVSCPIMVINITKRVWSVRRRSQDFAVTCRSSSSPMWKLGGATNNQQIFYFMWKITHANMRLLRLTKLLDTINGYIFYQVFLYFFCVCVCGGQSIIHQREKCR